MDGGGLRQRLRRRAAPTPDPGLDAFRDGIGTLTQDGVVVGYVASRVLTFWGLGRPTGLRECVWLYLHHLDDPDGNARRAELWDEDFPLWTLRPELENGSFHDDDRDATYTFRRLTGEARRGGSRPSGWSSRDPAGSTRVVRRSGRGTGRPRPDVVASSG